MFGEFRAPLTAPRSLPAQALDSNLSFWRTGMSLMEVNAVLPLDLAWSRPNRGSRQMPGDLAIRIEADSMNLAVLEAFTHNVRQIRGILKADVTVQGTWDAPRLGGRLVGVIFLTDAYGPLRSAARLLALAAGSGMVVTVEVGGELASCGLRAGATGEPDPPGARRDVPRLGVQGDGCAEFSPGSRRHRAAQGPDPARTHDRAGTAKNSVIYFSDLVSKSIVSLEDPLYSDLVDTGRHPPAGLGAELQNRFLDSLTIRNFALTAAEAVWLRSGEANIQLRAASRSRRRGTSIASTACSTRSGDLQPQVARDHPRLRRDPGTGHYLGDPDLNADLDIDAKHIIRPRAEATAKDIEVTAHIGGTLREAQARWPRASGRRCRRATSSRSWCSAERSTARGVGGPGGRWRRSPRSSRRASPARSRIAWSPSRGWGPTSLKSGPARTSAARPGAAR